MLPSHAVDRHGTTTTGDVCAAGSGERGAVLVHAAVAMAGLLAFSALTIDLGSMWVVRAQAQNAADAAALAGTVSLAYVSPTDTDAVAAAQAIVQAHRVWGEAIPPAATQITAGACPAGSPAVSGDCVNVTVGRGAAYGTPMPRFFAGLIGGSSANVRASASGKVLTGNSTTCLRPLAMPDAWNDTEDSTAPVDSIWTDDDLFDGYDGSGSSTGPPDRYTAPDAVSPGTGITVASMIGRRIVRRLYAPESGLLVPADGLFALDLPRPGMEAAHPSVRYSANLDACSGQLFSIGATASAFYPHRPHYTADPINQLINVVDDRAQWDPARGAVVGSRFPISPRILTVAVVDPEAFSRRARIGLESVPVNIRNFVGFFVESVGGTTGVEVSGVIVPAPGRFDQSAPLITADAAFLRSVALVR